MDVPLAVVYALSLVLLARARALPGAAISGLMRLLPSTVTGPRLLKEAIVLPVLMHRPYKMLHRTTADLLQWNRPGPELPAATTIMMPAAAWASTAACNVFKRTAFRSRTTP